MSFDAIFRNRIKQPLSRPMLAQGGEQTIVWSADASGVLTRLEEMERYVEQLQSRIDNLEYMAASRSVDLIPGPVDAGTFYELSSDGTLRAGLSVSVPPGGMFEIALFPEPGVKLSAADAYVDEGNPDVNHETDSLTVGNETDLKRSLVKVAADSYPDGYWDMPVIALLRLALFGTPDEQTLFCRCVTEDWEEDLVTWNAQPEAEDQVIDSHFVDETDTHAHFDVRPFLHRLRRLADEGNDLDFYGFRVEADEEREEGEVIFYSREGAPDDDSKPQLLYWFAPETSKVAQGGTKENRLYGKPGGVYWFAYRMMDANNNPSAWSVPVKVTLPSQGDAPGAPTISASRMSVSYIIQIVITYTPPADFNHYEIEVRDTDYGLIDTIITRNDRMVYESPKPAWLNRFRVRAVTRSGRTSSWSGYSEVSSTSDNRLKSLVGTSYILTSSSPGAEFGVQAGTRPKANVLHDGSYDMLIKKAKEIPAYCLDANRYNQLYEGGNWSTISTSWAPLKKVSYNPPGTGTALVLFMAILGNQGSSGRFRLRLDSSTTLIEEFGNDSGAYITVPLFALAQCSAGTEHNFYVDFRTTDGVRTYVYLAYLCVIDLGRA